VIKPKHQIHSEADLPRTSYPVTGSISTLLQSDDSVFAATVKKAATDLDALLANYDIQDKATLISILTAKLSLQELALIPLFTPGISTVTPIQHLILPKD
jgi:hypothetical protein